MLLNRELGGSAPAPLAGLWERVNADLDAPWTVAALAAHVCVSPGHLHRLSLIHHGVTPMAMVTRLRMRRAEAMLRSTDDTLDHIAAAVGYQTPFALSRAFKHHTGLSPREFRHRNAR